MERAGPLARPPAAPARRSRRQGEQLPLDVAAQADRRRLSAGRWAEPTRGRRARRAGDRWPPAPARAPSAISPRRGSGSAISRATGAATVGGGCRHASRAAREVDERAPVDLVSRRGEDGQRHDARRQDEKRDQAADRPRRSAPRRAGLRRDSGDPSGTRPRDAPRVLEPVQPIEHRQRLVRGRAAVDRRLQQPARFVAVAATERGDAVLQQLFGFALPLGQRAAGALDVGARARVAAIEKQRARPDVDGLLVVARRSSDRGRRAGAARSSRRDPTPSRRRSGVGRRCEADRT